MSRPAEKLSETHSVVSPPPSLAANGARHRSAANYVKSYGRSSFELQQKGKQQALQPAPQESLRGAHSKPTVRGGAGVRQVRSPVFVDPTHLAVSEDSDVADEVNDDDVDISPMTTPAQSYVPEGRRRGVLAGQQQQQQQHSSSPPPPPPTPAPRIALSGTRADMEADKENAHLRTLPGSTATTTAVVVAHGRPAIRSAPAAAPSASTTPAVLYRRTPSGTRGTGGIGRAPTSTSPSTTAQRSTQPPPPPRRTPSLKARPATAGPRKATAVPVRAKDTPSLPSAPDTQSNATSPPPPSTQPSPLPLSAALTTAPEESQPQRTPSPEVDWAVRAQVDQAEAIVGYVSDVMRALVERRRCGPPPDSTENFRASVVPCRRSGGHAHTKKADRGFAEDADEEDEDDGNEQDSAFAPSSSIALLPDLHRAASGLLSAFTKLEYAQLSDDVDLPRLEREAVERSSQLLRLVDGVDRQLALHETPEVRRLLAAHRAVFTNIHQLVDFVSRMSQQVVLLRGIAAHHDLVEARAVLDSFTRSVEAQEENQHRGGCEHEQSSATAEAARGGGDATAAARQFCFSPLRMLLGSPFFAWLEGRWFPTMRAWRQLVLEARQLASTGETDAAIRRSRQDALQIAGLHEILRPGETVSSLHHAQIVVPVTELEKSFAQKRAVMDVLRRVMEEKGETNTAALSKALRAAQAYTQVRSGRPSISGSPNSSTVAESSSHQDDVALVHKAEHLLARLREVTQCRQAVSELLQTPSPELLALLHHINKANELLLSWQLPHNEASAHAALLTGRVAIERCTETPGTPTPLRPSDISSHRRVDSPHGDGPRAPEVPPLNFNGLHRCPPSPPPVSTHSAVRWVGDGFPAGFNVRALYVPHTTAPSWPHDFGVLYRELCDVFSMLFLQRQAQRQLQLALGQMPEEEQRAAEAARRSGTNTTIATQHNTANGYTTPSPQITPRRPTKDMMSPATTQHSSEDGSPTLTATARSSDDVSMRPHPHLHGIASSGPSAEELKRRIQQAEEAGIGGALVDEARARLRRLLTIRLKIHFDAQTRMLPIADAAQAKFSDVYDHLHAHCQTQLAQSSSSGGAAPSPWADRRLRIRYEDADGDFISLLTQQDWDAMLSELHTSEGLGSKIELFCDYPIIPNMSTPPPEQQHHPSRNGECPESVSGLDFQTNDSEGEDAAAVAAAAAAATATPEKQKNVFARLASSKEVTPNAHGGRGAVNRTPRGRTRLGGGGLSPASSPHQALVPRTRSGAVSPGKVRPTSDTTKQCSPAAKGLAASRKGALESSPGKKSSTSAPPAAELTADNLRRNMFRSPPSTEGRPSGGDGGDGDAGRSSAGGAPSGKRAVAALKADSRRDQQPQQQQQQQQKREEAAPATDVAVATLAEGLNALQGGESAPRVVAKDNSFENQVPSSVIHLDMDGARRWNDGGEAGDDFQLLEIQTRASVSTVRMDPFVSASGFDMQSSSVYVSGSTTNIAAAGPSKGISRNNFTTSHCSSRGPSAAAKPATSLSPSFDHSTAASTPATHAEAQEANTPPRGAHEERQQGRLAQSPPRCAPRRWTSDDFSLDEVATVCSDRSRMAMQPAVARGPTTLPPRPQASGGAAGPANRTPQRMRRGARGTPTRSRPDGADGGAGGGEGERAEAADDVLAEMQRMREENTRAMAQPRKAVWH